MTLRVTVQPELLTWACERAGRGVESCRERFPKLDDWIARRAQPTLKQLEAFAAATHTPVGYFFLAEPPEERLPIPDMRTVANRRVGRVSADLLETIHLCQERQDWYREFARATGEEPLAFVGSANTTDDVVRAAGRIREALQFELAAHRQQPTYGAALAYLREATEGAGVLVMWNGIVGNNTRRKLDPSEFRGFALTDPMAPLIFLNAADAKVAQMFTLVHELAHIWLGRSALTDAGPNSAPNQADEAWCNRVAAEFLVPMEDARADFRRSAPLAEETKRLAQRYRVSGQVVLRRLLDVGHINRAVFEQAFAAELASSPTRRPASGGGDFYRTQASRLGKRFATAVVVSTLEGYTLYRDAYRLLGTRKQSSFEGLGQFLGVL